MDHTPADDLRVELGRAQSERDFYRKLVELGAQDALEAQVAERRFREDLCYRLHGFTIHVPSLDERREDIPELMEFFCARACEADGIPDLRLSPAAIRAAEAAEWPGNVRQLAARVREAVLRANDAGAPLIERAHLFPTRRPPRPSRRRAARACRRRPARSRGSSCATSWRRRAGTSRRRPSGSTWRGRTSTT